MAVSQTTMMAKVIMLLFPVGISLTLIYWGTTFFRAEEVRVSKIPAEEPAPITIADSVSTSTKSESTTTDAVVTSTLKTSQSATSTKTAEVVSSSPLHLGVYGNGWRNNSWGTTVSRDKNSTSLTAEYHKPWEAFSVYSEGVSVKAYRSIEVVFASESTDSRSLFLSLYDGAAKVGGVPLTPYQVPTKFGMFRIPLGDIATSSQRFTDIAIESDRAQTVRFSNLLLVDTNASSHLSELYPSPIMNTTPAVEPSTPVATGPVVATPPAPLAKGGSVFFQKLADGWKVVTRRGAVIDTMEDENRSVTGKAMKVHFTLQDGSLSFEHMGGADTTGYRYLHMMIYPGVTDHEWQQLIVTLYGANDVKLGTRDVMMYSGGGRLVMQTWNNANIPLSELGAANTLVKSIDIENVSVTQEGDHLWIDDVRFIDDYYGN